MSEERILRVGGEDEEEERESERREKAGDFQFVFAAGVWLSAVQKL